MISGSALKAQASIIATADNAHAPCLSMRARRRRGRHMRNSDRRGRWMSVCVPSEVPGLRAYPISRQKN